MLVSYLTRALEGHRKSTRLGGGRAKSAPPTISAPRRARKTKIGGRVGTTKISFEYKFGDPGSTSSRSNEVKYVEILRFFNWVAAQFSDKCD